MAFFALAAALLSIHTQDGASSTGRPSDDCVGAAPRETAGSPLGASTRGVLSAFDNGGALMVTACVRAAAGFVGRRVGVGCESFGFQAEISQLLDLVIS